MTRTAAQYATAGRSDPSAADLTPAQAARVQQHLRDIRADIEVAKATRNRDLLGTLEAELRCVRLNAGLFRVGPGKYSATPAQRTALSDLTAVATLLRAVHASEQNDPKPAARLAPRRGNPREDQRAVRDFLKRVRAEG